MKSLKPTKLFLEQELKGYMPALFSNSLLMSDVFSELKKIPREVDIPLYNAKEFILSEYYKPISKSIDLELMIKKDEI